MTALHVQTPINISELVRSAAPCYRNYIYHTDIVYGNSGRGLLSATGAHRISHAAGKTHGVVQHPVITRSIIRNCGRDPSSACGALPYVRSVLLCVGVACLVYLPDFSFLLLDLAVIIPVFTSQWGDNIGGGPQVRALIIMVMNSQVTGFFLWEQ